MKHQDMKYNKTNQQITKYSFSAPLFNFDVRDLVQILRQTAAVTDAT